ncbi:MAG: hypothetical protein J2P20_04050, partial [Pseudonocardia sp.]|nr:hypothetical protein [Pseudonocardia sp.]
MRNPWRGGSSSRHGRRGSGRPGTPPSGSPYDFTTENEERVDPVDLMAIRADDELLDALAAGRPVEMTFGGIELDHRFDTGYNDDQQVLAMLQAWRADVESEPYPEMISVEQASEAIVAGHRSARPRRRLVPVAAAAAVVVMALSGVAIGASNAQPGDPLWGVSTLLNGNRAKSVEAAYKVNLALTTAQQALAEGHPEEARAALANVGPELRNVNDQQRRDELSRKSTNLMDTAEVTTEGEKVKTREDGSPMDTDKSEQQKQRRKQRQSSARSGSSSSESGGSSGESGSGGSSTSTDSGGSEGPGGGSPGYDPRFGNPTTGVPGYPRPESGFPGTNPGFPGTRPNPGFPSFPGASPGFPGFPGTPGFPGDPRFRDSQKSSESQQPSEPQRPSPETAKPSDSAKPSQRPAPEQKPAPESQRPAPESKPATDTTKPDATKPETTKPATEATKQPSENGKQRSRPTGDNGGNN